MSRRTKKCKKNVRTRGKSRIGIKKQKKIGGASLVNRACIFTFTGTSGFGSTANFFIPVYILAKKQNRPFFLDDSSWYYGKWHDYFKSLNIWAKPQKDNTVEYTHGNTVEPSLVKDYTDAINDIYVLNDDLMNTVNKFKEEIGGPYKSIYVRRGDKVSGASKENDATDLAELLKMTDIQGGDNLFVMTDDYTVIEELKEIMPDLKISTMTKSSMRGANSLKLEALEKELVNEHGKELFTSIQVLLGSTKGWVDNRSNMGRFIKLASPNTMILYPQEPNSDITADTMIIDPGRILLGHQPKEE